MKYPDGQEIKLGDRVELWPNNHGTVVCSIDTGEYAAAYPKEQWDYLGHGIVVLSEAAGLVHYGKPEPSMRLIKRDAVP